MDLGGIREIPLTRGLVALVDAADYEWLNQWRWRVHRSAPGKPPYAVRSGRTPAGAWGQIRMHRQILGSAPGELVDHANADSLDNRRENLRSCTHSDNNANRVVRCGPIGFRGVRARGQRFRASIRKDGKRHDLGYFSTAEEAAAAYDAAATTLHGEFAVVNFPEAA